MEQVKWASWIEMSWTGSARTRALAAEVIKAELVN